MEGRLGGGGQSQQAALPLARALELRDVPAEGKALGSWGERPREM